MNDNSAADATADSALNFTRSLVPKPSKMPTNAADFEDWKLDFENYMSLIKPEFGDEQQSQLVALANQFQIQTTESRDLVQFFSMQFWQDSQ